MENDIIMSTGHWPMVMNLQLKKKKRQTQKNAVDNKLLESNGIENRNQIAW